MTSNFLRASASLRESIDGYFTRRRGGAEEASCSFPC